MPVALARTARSQSAWLAAWAGAPSQARPALAAAFAPTKVEQMEPSALPGPAGVVAAAREHCSRSAERLLRSARTERSQQAEQPEAASSSAGYLRLAEPVAAVAAA